MPPRETRSSKTRDARAEVASSAIAALERGEVIVFPTETFYGLGADALDAHAVERVVNLKGRNPDSPIAVIVANQEMLGEIVASIPPLARILIDHLWPGPLTLVLPAKKGLLEPLLNREGKIGVRVSSHPVAARLAGELRRPITATSANPSGAKPARTVEEARSYFSGKVKIFVDGGRLAGNKGSSVVDVAAAGVKIIREGAISAQTIERVIGSWRGSGGSQRR